jgi:tetratricopeptide (TPR) repeat protein
LSQRDREIALIQETNRLVTIYSLALGGVGLAALLASAWIFYKSMVSAARAPLAMASSPAVADSANLLPASSPADAGIGRVRSSGHRLQSRMSELEDRLSELEDLAGKAPGDGSDGETPPRVAGEASLNSDSEIAVPAETRAERIIPRAAILTRKAEALANLGKLQEALAVLDEAASSDPTLEDTHMVRGRVLEKMGRLGDALEAYDRAVGIDDANTGALLLKAGILNRQERFSEALACYERALEAHKGNS